MARQDDFRFHLGSAGNGRVEVLDLEPQEYAVSIGLVVWIADRPVMVPDLEGVQLEDQRVTRNQPLVFGTTVRALTPEEALIPSAAGFDVTHGDKRLWMHQDLHLMFRICCWRSLSAGRAG